MAFYRSQPCSWLLQAWHGKYPLLCCLEFIRWICFPLRTELFRYLQPHARTPSPDTLQAPQIQHAQEWTQHFSSPDPGPSASPVSPALCMAHRPPSHRAGNLGVLSRPLTPGPSVLASPSSLPLSPLSDVIHRVVRCPSFLTCTTLTACLSCLQSHPAPHSFMAQLHAMPCGHFRGCPSPQDTAAQTRQLQSALCLLY